MEPGNPVSWPGVSTRMDTHNGSNSRVVLVTGASGYVGGRLVAALEAKGERVRCLARTPEYLKGRFSPATEIVRGDALDPGSLDPALRGVDTAYYLVHSMGSRADFQVRDRACARNFARAARRQGVRRGHLPGGTGRPRRPGSPPRALAPHGQPPRGCPRPCPSRPPDARVPGPRSSSVRVRSRSSWSAVWSTGFR